MLKQQTRAQYILLKLFLGNESNFIEVNYSIEAHSTITHSSRKVLRNYMQHYRYYLTLKKSIKQIHFYMGFFALIKYALGIYKFYPEGELKKDYGKI